MVCAGCDNDDELRMGFCFNCASAGEERALRRTVVQHCLRGLRNLRPGHFWKSRIDFSWAWERLTKTGDYARIQ
jgi:hypothetical protein